MMYFWDGRTQQVARWVSNEETLQLQAEALIEDGADVIYFFADESPIPVVEYPIVIDLDPEWTCAQIYSCGHVQHACCRDHLDPTCELCVKV